jgi:phage-related protein
MPGLGVLTGPITTLAKFSAILSAITIAASAAVAALPPLIGFIIQLGEASVGVAALLPAALATGITLLGTFKIAVNDVGKAISTGLSGEMKQFEKAIKNLPAPTQEFVKAVVSLKPAIEQVKLSIGTRFFADLADDAKTLGNLYLPLVAHQMSQVAGAFNEGFQRAAAFLSTESTFKDFSVIFEDMPKIAAELANSLAPLLRIFTDLAVVGSGFLPTLIRGLSSAATAAADFVSRMRETGQLESFISKGLSFFGELFNLLTQIGGTFSAIFSSANAVGGGLLGTLTQIFTATNQFFSSIQGQETLATVFSSVQEVVGATLPILLTLAESIAPIVGALLPAFAQGLQALLPAAQPVGDALVAIATAVAPLIPLIGNLLAFALTFVAGILQQFATLLTPLTTLFSQLASAVLPVLTEALTQLINAGMGPLIGMVIQVIAAFAPLIPVISQIVTQFVSALMPSLLQLQSTFISAVIPVVLQLVQALAGGLLDTLVSILPQVPALTNAAIELVKAFTSLLSAVLPLLPPLVKMISNFISSQAGSESLTIAIGILTTTIRVVANTINIAVTVLNFLINSFVNTRNAAFAMASALSGAVSSALNTVRNLGNQVIGALSGAGSWLYGAGQAIVSGLVNGIKSAAGRAASAARDVVQNALSAARRALGIGSPSKEFAKLGKFSVQGFERGVSDDRDMQRTVDAVFRSTSAMEGTPGNQNTSNTQPVVFAPGSINIGFNGVVPSQQEAQQVGAAVADGITNQLAKNQVRTLTRMM